MFWHIQYFPPGIFMRSFPIPLEEIEENINAIDGSGALELEHVIAMKR